MKVLVNHIQGDKLHCPVFRRIVTSGRETLSHNKINGII